MYACRRFRARFRRISLGAFPGSTWGSKRRNRLSFVALLTSILLLIDLLFGIHIVSTTLALYAICALSPIYLYLISLAVIWLESDEFRVSPSRLIRDVAISIGFTITVFASAYWTFGITPTYNDAVAIRPLDSLYFSIVTFTTLGYGDFRPSEPARMLAAFQALLGTVHVGLIVGAALVAVGDKRA